MTIKRVEPVSLAKIFGIVNAIGGLLAGAFFAAMASLGTGMHRAMPGPGGGLFGGTFGAGAIVVLPILYGILGFIGGLIGGALYNWIAGFAGGIVIETE